MKIFRYLTILKDWIDNFLILQEKHKNNEFYSKEVELYISKFNNDWNKIALQVVEQHGFTNSTSYSKLKSLPTEHKKDIVEGDIILNISDYNNEWNKFALEYIIKKNT